MSTRQTEDRESGDLHCCINVMLQVGGHNWQSGNFCLNWRPSDDSGGVTSFHIGAVGASNFEDEIKFHQKEIKFWEKQKAKIENKIQKQKGLK